MNNFPFQLKNVEAEKNNIESDQLYLPVYFIIYFPRKNTEENLSFRRVRFLTFGCLLHRFAKLQGYQFDIFTTNDGKFAAECN